jgi:hypothetical protein
MIGSRRSIQRITILLILRDASSLTITGTGIVNLLRKLKKTEELSRRNDEARAANSANCNRIPATVALGRRQTSVLTQERRDQGRRHRETLLLTT